MLYTHIYSHIHILSIYSSLLSLSHTHTHTHNSHRHHHRHLLLSQMAGITNGALIAIVIVACLAVVSLIAAVFGTWKPKNREQLFRPGSEQSLYMRSVRKKTHGHFRREAARAKFRDLEEPVLPPCMCYDFFIIRGTFSWTRVVLAVADWFCCFRSYGESVVVTALISS